MDPLKQEPKPEIEVLRTKSLTKKTQDVKLKEIPKYWDKSYILERINKVENPRDAMFLRFLWMSGLRISEAIGFRKQDIDFQNYALRVRWLKSRKYKERIVPLHPRLRDSLQMFTAAKNQEDIVFPFTRQRGWQIVQENLKGHPHQLRHSFSVNWLRNGGDLVSLHRLLGHNKVQTTMEYLKIVPTDLGKELMKINFD